MQTLWYVMLIVLILATKQTTKVKVDLKFNISFSS